MIAESSYLENLLIVQIILVEDFGETEREALKSMAVKIIKKVLDEAQSIAFAVKNSGI